MRRHRGRGRTKLLGITFSQRPYAVRVGIAGRVFLIRRACQADSCGVDLVAVWLRRAALAPSCRNSTSGAAM